MKLTKEQLMAGAQSLANSWGAGYRVTPPDDSGGWRATDGYWEQHLCEDKVVIRALVLVALGNTSE